LSGEHICIPEGCKVRIREYFDKDEGLKAEKQSLICCGLKNRPGLEGEWVQVFEFHGSVGFKVRILVKKRSEMVKLFELRIRQFDLKFQRTSGD
jgi:hypothetical protein